MEHQALETGSKDCRKDWFMQQHFSPEELQQIYDWEQESGKIAKVIKDTDGFVAYHILDGENKIYLCRMKEEYMLRRWLDRLSYNANDGKTVKQFEEETGIKEEPVIKGKEIFRTPLPNDNTSITQYGEREFKIVSGDYAIVTKRTASNAFKILLLDSKEYNEYLQSKNK